MAACARARDAGPLRMAGRWRMGHTSHTSRTRTVAVRRTHQTPGEHLAPASHHARQYRPSAQITQQAHQPERCTRLPPAVRTCLCGASLPNRAAGCGGPRYVLVRPHGRDRLLSAATARARRCRGAMRLCMVMVMGMGTCAPSNCGCCMCMSTCTCVSSSTPATSTNEAWYGACARAHARQHLVAPSIEAPRVMAPLSRSRSSREPQRR